LKIIFENVIIIYIKKKLNTFFIIFLSNTLYNIAFKLKTDTLKIKEEKLYSETLLKKSLLLEKTKNYKKLSLNRTTGGLQKRFEKEDFMIVYVITVVFLKANTHIHLSNIKGNVKLSYNSGSVNLLGKQKKNRVKAISRLISLLIKKTSFLKNCPVSVHLYNVNSHKTLILNKLKNNFFIRLVKIFNQTPYNGCRKKKMRRKKYVKKFK
jgi:ribosomal protein S11